MNDFVAAEVRDATPEETAGLVPAREPRGTTVVREHGELGPVLVSVDQDFTTEQEAVRRRKD